MTSIELTVLRSDHRLVSGARGLFRPALARNSLKQFMLRSLAQSGVPPWSSVGCELQSVIRKVAYGGF